VYQPWILAVMLPTAALAFTYPDPLSSPATIEDCLYKAKWGMEEHIALLKERGLTIQKAKVDTNIMIKNTKRLAGVR
jgi:hypothetical protein